MVAYSTMKTILGLEEPGEEASPHWGSQSIGNPLRAQSVFLETTSVHQPCKHQSFPSLPVLKIFLVSPDVSILKIEEALSKGQVLRTQKSKQTNNVF